MLMSRWAATRQTTVPRCLWVYFDIRQFKASFTRRSGALWGVVLLLIVQALHHHVGRGQSFWYYLRMMPSESSGNLLEYFVESKPNILRRMIHSRGVT